MPRKGQSKKAISKAYFPIGQHAKKQEGLERSVFEISRNSKEVKLCKKEGDC